MSSSNGKKVEILVGDLFEIPTDMIVQQLNCLTLNAKHLSQKIAEKYFWADVYSRRRKLSYNLAIPLDRPLPGTIVVDSPPEWAKEKGPCVVGIFGQYEMGAPGKYVRIEGSKEIDTKENRQEWFRSGLQHLVTHLWHHPEIKFIHFPWKIGCGQAQGEWTTYLKMIEDFAERIPATMTVRIIRLPNEK